jgi:hypothetical protein
MLQLVQHLQGRVRLVPMQQLMDVMLAVLPDNRAL